MAVKRQKEELSMLIKIIEKQGELAGALGRVEENLGEHMRRTSNLEGQVESLWKANEKATLSIAKAQGAIALLSLISLIVGLVAAFARIFS